MRKYSGLIRVSANFLLHCPYGLLLLRCLAKETIRKDTQTEPTHAVKLLGTLPFAFDNFPAAGEQSRFGPTPPETRRYCGLKERRQHDQRVGERK
jgi:hypothetical protein